MLRTGASEFGGGHSRSPLHGLRQVIRIQSPPLCPPRMALDKLAEGIKGFAADQDKLEVQIAKAMGA